MMQVLLPVQLMKGRWPREEAKCHSPPAQLGPCEDYFELLRSCVTLHGLLKPVY